MRGQQEDTCGCECAVERAGELGERCSESPDVMVGGNDPERLITHGPCGTPIKNLGARIEEMPNV
jgi:hypothetical protein